MSMERPKPLQRGDRQTNRDKWSIWKQMMKEHGIDMIEKYDENITYRLTRVEKWEDEHEGYIPSLKVYYIGEIFNDRKLEARVEIHN